jgi:hypothetical protein
MFRGYFDNVITRALSGPPCRLPHFAAIEFSQTNGDLFNSPMEQ